MIAIQTETDRVYELMQAISNLQNEFKSFYNNTFIIDQKTTQEIEECIGNMEWFVKMCDLTISNKGKIKIDTESFENHYKMILETVDELTP